MNPYARLPPFDRESGALNVVIDTPKGSRNKYAWDEKLELFSLTGVLPAGAVFPYDFGLFQTRSAVMAIRSMFWW